MGGGLRWLSKLVDEAQLVQPLEASQSTLNALRHQRRAAQGLGAEASRLGNSQLASGNHQIGSALLTAIKAPEWDDATVRLLNYPTPDGAISRAALAYRTPGCYDDGLNPLLQNGVYIESLGSAEKGLGRAALQGVADRYRDLPLILESLPLEDTLQFYRNRGFQRLERNPVGGSLPFFYLRRGADLKAAGGAVRATPKTKREAVSPLQQVSRR